MAEAQSDLPRLSKPAMRALARHGVARLADLGRFSRQQIAGWHGIGPTALIAFDAALEAANLTYSPETGDANA